MPADARTRGEGPSGAAPAGAPLRLAVLAFVLFATAVVAGGLAYRRAYAAAVRADRAKELATVARLKAEQVRSWRGERLGNGWTMHDNPGMSRASWPLVEDPDPRRLQEHLRAWFPPVARHYGYSDLAVLDTSLRTIMRYDDRAPPLPESSRELAARALASDEVLLGDPARDGEIIRIDLAIPLTATGEGRPPHRVGVLLLRADVNAVLGEILREWPTTSETGEMFLVVRDGERAFHITELRWAPGTIRQLSFPMDRTELPSVRGLRGARGVLEGADYRGVPVLAAIEEVPGSPWILVAKIDLDEAIAPARAMARVVDASLVSLLGVAGLTLVLWWRHQLGLQRERRLARETARLDRNFAQLLEHVQDAVFLADDQGRITAVNDRFAAMYGWPRDQLAGRPLHEVLGRNPDELRDTIADVRRRGGATVERLHRRRDGTPFPVEASLRHYDAQDGGTSLLGIVRDVSERKRAEAQVRLQDRLTAMGTLAAGVAHEINNPLSFVMSNVEWALERISAGAPSGSVASALAEARDGALRVQAIVRDLKTFSRTEEEEAPRSIDPAAVLRSSLNLASNAIRARAQLVTAIGEIPRVDASEQRLGQVFLNLLLNAAQAIPPGRDGHEIHAIARTGEDGSAVIEVRDTGTGIKPELLRRIFEPFFTTRGAGEGTGLGLSICSSIVAQFGGRIEVESEPGVGSTFRVVLPPSRLPVTVTPAPASAAEPGRPGSVLVVDDEPLVASSVARLLASTHRVVSVTSGREALARWESGERFDVVLCDLMMPEMTGMELHDALARLDPGAEARMVFMTGGTFTEHARQFLETTPNAWIEKPFEARALRDLVASRLSA